ncbi:MAG: hypothetical protein SGJ27_08940 [Candidatus Melainabacteria bacterium]|nr:hypothetical protein [Candidatus Melainabacteria bacterium]
MIPDTNWLFPIAFIQAGFLGLIATEIAREAGPKTVKMASIVATVLSFILGIVLSTPATLVPCAVGYAVLTMLFSYWYGEKVIAAGIRKQFELAPDLVRFGLRNYSRFADKNGITTAALHDALDEGTTFSEEEAVIVKHLLRHICDIGHVVDTIIVGYGSPHGGGAQAVAVYAVNEQDLRSYQTRLKRKYGAWLQVA